MNKINFDRQRVQFFQNAHKAAIEAAKLRRLVAAQKSQPKRLVDEAIDRMMDVA